MSPAPILHATLIAKRLEGRWAGVLIRGPSGAGKSDLALRALDAGWRLVADDRVRIWRSGEALYGAPGPNLAGLLEVRGVGVLAQAALPWARIRLILDAAGPAASVERVPEPSRLTLCGVALPRLELALLEPSAPAKLERALRCAARSVL